MQTIGNLDAAETALFLRELVDIQTQVARTPRGEFIADRLIPLDTSIKRGATSWAYRRIDAVGMAELIGSKSNNFPYVDVHATETVVPMFEFALGYYYTWSEVQARALYQTPLEAERAMACKQGHYAARNRLALQGDAKLGIPGFVNDASVPTTNAATGTWGDAARTPRQIIGDITLAISAVNRTVRQTMPVTTVVLPPTAWDTASTTTLSDLNPTTILAHLKQIYPQITFEQLTELETAGVGATRRMIVYRRDEGVLVQKASVLYDELPPQPDGQLFRVPALSLIGGTHWKMPIAGLYVDGI